VAVLTLVRPVLRRVSRRPDIRALRDSRRIDVDRDFVERLAFESIDAHVAIR